MAHPMRCSVKLSLLWLVNVSPLVFFTMLLMASIVSFGHSDENPDGEPPQHFQNSIGLSRHNNQDTAALAIAKQIELEEIRGRIATPDEDTDLEDLFSTVHSQAAQQRMKANRATTASINAHVSVETTSGYIDGDKITNLMDAMV
jgi:hypothetical protein